MQEFAMHDPATVTASDQTGQSQPSGAPMSPGDEAPADTPGTGPNVCPRCGGSGRVDAGVCPECEGTGQVNVGIGGA
jgi:DnaJ-class molecular chaperone